VCQNLVPLVNIKIAGKWMFIPLKMVLIGIDPYPYVYTIIYIRTDIDRYGNHLQHLSFHRIGLAGNLLSHGLQPKRRDFHGPLFLRAVPLGPWKMLGKCWENAGKMVEIQLS